MYSVGNYIMEDEIWKDVVDYEGLYQVSSFGRVKNKRTSLILKGSVNKSGYVDVKLYGKEKNKTVSIHILVAMAFLGYKPNGTKHIVCDHIDNNKQNNNLFNLRLITHRNNVRKGIVKMGSKYFGVTKNCNYSVKWRARFYHKNKSIHVGYFNNEYQAHLAVERKIEELTKNTKQ